MDWIQFYLAIITAIAGLLGVIAANFGLFLWARSDSKAELLSMQARTDAILFAIQQEIKDFHGRLCTIEERGKGLSPSMGAKTKEK